MIQKLFFNKADRGIIQLIRYGFVVMIAAPIDLGGYILLATLADLNYTLASAISFTVSMLVNYVLCIKWIWPKTDERQMHKDIIIFFLIGFAGLGLTMFLVWLFTSVLSIHFILAKLITFGFVFIWSFGSRRYLFTCKHFIPSTLTSKE